MVDLAKIRKKAKKAKEEAAEPPVAPAPTPVAEPGQPEVSARAAEPPATAPAPAAPAPVSPPIPPPAEPPMGSSKLEKFKELAGRRREADTGEAASAEAAVPSEALELLTFALAAEQYAVDIERIVEIVTPRPVTRIPNSDPSVVGITSLRGTIVTLVDVRRKLGHPPAGEADADTRIVVIDNGSETVGFTVDRVLRVVKVAAGGIEPHPVVHSEELDESIRGVFRVNGALTILLDLEKLLDHNALT